MNLEKIYKYLEIDPSPVRCEYKDEQHICTNPVCTEYNEKCEYSWECCRFHKLIYEYPKIDPEAIPNNYILSIIDVLLPLGIKGIMDENKENILRCKRIEVKGKTRNEVILTLLEKLLEQNKFNKKQKEQLFYVISYIEMYQEER